MNTYHYIHRPLLVMTPTFTETPHHMELYFQPQYFLKQRLTILLFENEMDFLCNAHFNSLFFLIQLPFNMGGQAQANCVMDQPCIALRQNPMSEELGVW